MRPHAVLVAFAFLAATAVPAHPEPTGVAVEIANASEPVLCAEKDNVTLNLLSPDVRRFRVEATHPAYVGTLRADRQAPDWSDCDISAESSAAPEPRRVLFDDGGEVFLLGLAYGTFWRPNDVPVRVGNRVERGLDIVQLHLRRPGGSGASEEVLVVYPADGYWRLKPLSPPHLPGTAYGSSVLLGPVEVDGRPVVNLQGIAFDPDTRTFALSFADGGGATVRVEAADDERLRLDVAFDRAVSGRPFASLRSMYVTEGNADVARVAVRNGSGWREDGVMRLGPARATALWAGRLLPSRHNTSAPDMTFSRFGATGASGAAGPTPVQDR